MSFPPPSTPEEMSASAAKVVALVTAAVADSAGDGSPVYPSALADVDQHDRFELARMVGVLVGMTSLQCVQGEMVGVSRFDSVAGWAAVCRQVFNVDTPT